MAESDVVFPWPEGKRAAVAVTFDMDAESVMLSADPALADRPSIWVATMQEIAARLPM